MVKNNCNVGKDTKSFSHSKPKRHSLKPLLTIVAVISFMMTGIPVLAGKTKEQQQIAKAETIDENFLEQLLKTDDPDEIKRLVRALTAPRTFEANFENNKKAHAFYNFIDKTDEDIFLDILENINKNITQYTLKPKKKLSLYKNLHISLTMTQILSSDHTNEETRSIVLDSLLQRLSYTSGISDCTETFGVFAGKDLFFYKHPKVQQVMEQLKLLKDKFKTTPVFYKRLSNFYLTCLKGLEEAQIRMHHWEAFIETTLQGGEFNPQVIFSDIAVGEEPDPIDIKIRSTKSIVNNTGYIEDIGTVNKGKVLSLPDGTPIGYNITLAKYNKDIRGVLVDVYGGFQKSQREEKAHRPIPSSLFTQFLLRNGVVEISLNLPDLLELDVFQGKMPSEVHDHIHAAINKFYEVITQEPETLHPSLSILKKQLPIALYGASFGGRTAIRHGELYPETFTHYISHDGTLSYRMLGLSDTKLALGRHPTDIALEEKDFAPAYLSPMLGMDSLQDPVLLLHNLDDNNVNIKVSLDFFQKAKKDGRDVSLFITEESNPIPEKKEEMDLPNKGHYTPDTMEYFVPYMNAIVNFIANGPSAIPEMGDWRSYKYNLYANKHYRSATFEERCIAEMFRLYKTAIPFRAYKDNAAQIMEKDKEESVWNEYYQPVLTSLYHLDYLMKHPITLRKEFKRIKDQGLLTPEVLGRAAEHYFYASQQFIEEFHKLKLPGGLNQRKILQNVMPQFQEWVDLAFEGKYEYSNYIVHNLAFEGKHEYTNYILHSLYIANPELVRVDELYDKNEQSLISGLALMVRKQLIESIHEERRLARKAIGAAMMKAAKKLPAQREEDRKAALLTLDSLVATEGVEIPVASDTYSCLIKTASRQKPETIGPIKAKYESLLEAWKDKKDHPKKLRNWQLAKLSHTLLLEENIKNMEESFKEVYQSYKKSPSARRQALSEDLGELLNSMPVHSEKTKIGKAMRQRIDHGDFQEAWKN